MEIKKESFDWLIQIQVLSPTDLYDDSYEDVVVLVENATRQIENAVSISRLIKILYAKAVTSSLRKKIKNKSNN